MARTVQSEEERERRIVLVGEYVKETGASTRDTARYFTETYFPISNCTVSDYCARYCKMRPEEVDELRGKINNNTMKSIEDPEVRNRVEYHAALLANGMTIQQISEATQTNFWTVYREIFVYTSRG